MKKSIIFIAAIIFAICFTACGNSGEKNTQTETTTNGIKLTEQQLEYLKKLRSDITGIRLCERSNRTVSFSVPRTRILLPMCVGWEMSPAKPVILVGRLPTLYASEMNGRTMKG